MVCSHYLGGTEMKLHKTLLHLTPLTIGNYSCQGEGTFSRIEVMLEGPSQVEGSVDPEDQSGGITEVGNGRTRISFSQSFPPTPVPLLDQKPENREA